MADNGKEIRVFFSKTDECRYIGHLDVNTVIHRALQKAKIPVWRTQGYNIHAYITFSNPLSLGFSSVCESFDMRIVDKDFDIYSIPERMNKCLPHGLEILSVGIPKYKNSMITDADYEISLYSDDISNETLYSKLKDMLEGSEIKVEKKTKKGVKEIDLKDYFNDYDLSLRENVFLKIKLPSGGGMNINPTLFISKLEKDNDIEIYYDIKRVKMYVENDEFS